MSFIAENPLTIPKASKAPSAPIHGARGLFAKEDGWYDIDDSGNERKIISKDDLDAEIPEIADNLTSTDTDKALSANQGKVLNDSKADKATTIEGYGITDAALKKDLETKLDFTEDDLANIDNISNIGFYKINARQPDSITLEQVSEYYYLIVTYSDEQKLAQTLIDSSGIKRRYNSGSTLNPSTWTEWENISPGIETTPTENSTKLITSGGVYRAAELAKKADREEMLDKLCPHGEAESASASVTVPDGLGGTVLRDWSITGAEGGVGDLNSETGKYDIPVTVRGINLFKPQTETANIELHGGNISISPFRDGAVVITGIPMSNYYNYISFCQPCAFSNSASTAAQVNDVIVPQGNSFVLSWKHIIGTAAFDYIILTDSTGTSHGINTYYTAGYKKVSALDYDVCNIYFRFPYGNTGYKFNDVYRFQVTLGTEDLPFEPYGEPQTVTISLDAPLGAGESIGKINTGTDIPLVATGTNIIDVGTTVAPGKVAIDYYKDINTVLNNITNAILSQGGNV